MSKIRIPLNGSEYLAALFLPPDHHYDYVMIACHGFRGSKENQGNIYNLALRLNTLGIAVLAFDFRGTGESSGDFSRVTLSRQAKDVDKVIDYAVTEYGKPVILLGRSFGGTSILAGGTEAEHVKGFIFWSTPVSLETTFARIWGDRYTTLQKGQRTKLEDEKGTYVLGPDFVTDLKNHDFAQYRRNLGDRPVLIIHGKQDEVVAEDDAVFLHEQTNSKLFLLEQADHQFSGHVEVRDNMTINWLRLNLLQALH